MENYFQDYCMVLKCEPIGEFDRRLVLLSKDHGKITAYAKGARRQTNKLMAATDLFCFGNYKFYANQNSYSMVDAAVTHYFEEFRTDYEGALYGMYFLEVAEFITQENNDDEEILKLLFQACRAAVSDVLPNKLVKLVFELKAMMLHGEFDLELGKSYSETAQYTINYMFATKPEKIYSFKLKDEVLNELVRLSFERRKKIWNHNFNCEEMLKTVES